MNMPNLDLLERIAYILVLIGGIDYGLYGLFQFHLIEVFLGAHFLGRVFFIVIGVAAGYLVYNMFAKKKVVSP